MITPERAEQEVLKHACCEHDPELGGVTPCGPEKPEFIKRVKVLIAAAKFSALDEVISYNANRIDAGMETMQNVVDAHAALVLEMDVLEAEE